MFRTLDSVEIRANLLCEGIDVFDTICFFDAIALVR